MSVLSSYTLFHFTSSLENLGSILKGGLRYSWIAEKLPIPRVGYLLQSICFCNIPLSMIEEHTDWYGRYAIGFKRSFLRKNGASPVFYLHSDSALLYRGIEVEKSYNKEKFLPYFKLYYGKQYHSGAGKHKFKKFYDEKEWRIFVGNAEVVRFKDMNELERLRQNKKLIVKEEKMMRISPEMIEYIILEKPTDLSDFKDFIKNNNVQMLEDMLTKVLFYNQIRRDF